MNLFLTIDYIRKEIQDRFPSDNEIELDLFFSDDEIMHAMLAAANAYNGLAPIGVEVVTGLHLPAFGTNVFVDATVSQLYKLAIYKLTRNLITWNTGDSTVDVDKTRLLAFLQAQLVLELLWIRDAKERKAEINRRRCWSFL